MPSKLQLHGRLASHMVLQRERLIPILGWAEPNQNVVITLDNETLETTTDQTGRFHINFPPRDAGGPVTLTVTSGDETIELTDILFGDVWLCSGQSNMAMLVSATDITDEEIATSSDDQLRHGRVSIRYTPEPADDTSVIWQTASPEVVREFSGTGYFFARHLREEVGVPIGVLIASVGHTPAESWMSRASLDSDPDFAHLLNEWDSRVAEHPDAIDDYAKYQTLHAQEAKAHSKLFTPWYEAALAAQAAGEPIPKMPTPPYGLGNPQMPMTLYNGNIAPLTPFPIRGFAWYQGETNAIFARGYEYRKLFRTLIRSWREAFDANGNGDMPFCFVQIANHADVQCEQPEAYWAELREAQLHALAEPNTAMATTIDIGHTEQIHPKNKRDVGKRLALGALRLAYGRRSEYLGPIYSSYEIENGAVRVRFTHADGLTLKQHERGSGFIVCGEDRNFVEATATVDGDSVIIQSKTIANPIAARYAWTHDPPATLFNAAGLPASPFRTDDFPTVSR